MLTQSVENYLKAIFHLQHEGKKGVSTSSLSEMMNTKAASVSEMVKKLADKNLVSYKKYYGVELTELGQQQALNIIRKHRLWESFLVERLQFGWDEVHEVAEQLEHIKSEKLVDAIDKLLEYPKTDPHGDPIPDKQGNLPKIEKSLLSECKVGCKGELIGVKDSSPIFLHYLDNQDIKLGSTFVLKAKEEFDQSLEMTINNKPLRISHKMASNLFVEIVS